MKKISSLLLIIVAVVSLLLVGCGNDPNKDDNNVDTPENIIKESNYNILKDTPYETTIYVYESSISGPTYFISGGIHGDEIAGWKAALQLVDGEHNFRGKVIILPRTNYLATILEKRYPGIGNNGVYNNVTYSDLNRSFPGKEDGTVTEQISYAITQEVIKYEPDYIVDFHESLHSYATSNSKNLGDEVIYGNDNSSLFAIDLVDNYNSNYKPKGAVDVIIDANSPEGSFNKYLATYFPDSYAFTFETNRELDLEVRIQQQLNLLKTLFELSWK